MLATDKAREANSLIGKYVDTFNLALRTSSSIPIGNGQELYILSDDEIKEGEFGILNGQIVKCAYNGSIVTKGAEKIIATTNSDLKVKYPEIREDSYLSLPQIPLDFIKHFISEYNKGNVITEVEVEYDGYTNDSDVGNYEFINKGIKINQDNTINISIVEEKLYSKTDIINALHQVELKHKKDMSIIYSQLIEFL